MKGFGIIGTGMIAEFHAAAIKAIPQAELIGVYSRNSQVTKEFAVQHVCQPYNSLEELLQDNRVDIVTIATPSGAHLEPCLTAADAGKHIICEKPLEINEDRIRQIIKACHNNKVVLSGIFNRRFNPAVKALKRAIDKGRFGQIALCSAYIKWYRDQAYYDSGAWRGTKSLDGGGALMNQGIHTIDLLQYLAGPIDSLCGSVATISHENIEVEDTAVALLNFNNGAKGVIEGSTSCWSSSGHAAEIHICGSEGSVFLKDDKFSVWDFKNMRPEDEMVRQSLMETGDAGLGANDPNAINVDGHIANFADVLEAIEKGAKPSVNGWEAMKSVRIINSIYNSAEDGGKWINLE